MKNKSLVVITGCDSGIGKSLAGLLSENGVPVAISYLESNPFQDHEEVFALKMDLRNQKNIKDFAAFVGGLIHNGYRLDWFIHNAGIAQGGPVENLPLELFREVFEVNYFGLLFLTQKIIPLLIEQKSGLMIIGSKAGKIAVPFLSPYVSTKFALEGFCDSLRRELNPFGIKTVLVEPGGINTPIWTKAKQQDISFVDKKYMQSLQIFQKRFIDPASRAMPAEKAAIRIWKLMRKKNPKPRYLIDDNNFLSWLVQRIPDRLMDKIMRRLFAMDYGNQGQESGAGP